MNELLLVGYMAFTPVNCQGMFRPPHYALAVSYISRYRTLGAQMISRNRTLTNRERRDMKDEMGRLGDSLRLMLGDTSLANDHDWIERTLEEYFYAEAF